ncbi:MAG: type II secretion system protein N [Piscinibacter sp.]|uniref:type II secretion system protein N n=1 Tax=Piscinibacter sp. TaxID=1903157 RepID=UPI00258876D5|nr:type II secretion system protein N [Piscinibacter sp.]MCW5667118.1 type II secretion system protein N [Piscinibacter sp.]
MIRRRKGRAWAHTAAATGWSESTFAELSWDRSRAAGMRWGLFGAVLGALIALVLFAPAAWLARGLASATGEHLLLADARGTVWSGSAVAVLTGGPGSRDASALPGRLEWTLVPSGLGFELRLRQACCLNGTAVVAIRPGFGRVTVALQPGAEWIGQWPSAWLGGLGTPWNTLQLGGTVRLSSPGLAVESVQGRWRLTGRADIDLQDVSSRLSTLDTLGSYRLSISGDPNGAAQMNLATQQGTLQLSGSGSIAPSGVRFRGEARAAEGGETALANLLNIIGRRDGARSVISIG